MLGTMISGYGDLEAILMVDYDSSIDQLRSVECMISYSRNFMYESDTRITKETTFHLVSCGNYDSDTRHLSVYWLKLF